MVFGQHQSHSSVFPNGPVARVATVFLAAVLFVLTFVFGALVAAVAVATGVVVWAKLWWSNRHKVGDRKAGGRAHLTLDGDYQVLSSGRTDEGSDEIVEVKKGE
jgi:hypothetical protein